MGSHLPVQHRMPSDPLTSISWLPLPFCWYAQPLNQEGKLQPDRPAPKSCQNQLWSTERGAAFCAIYRSPVHGHLRPGDAKPRLLPEGGGSGRAITHLRSRQKHHQQPEKWRIGAFSHFLPHSNAIQEQECNKSAQREVGRHAGLLLMSTLTGWQG